MSDVRVRLEAHGPVIENPWIRLSVRLDDGTFSLASANGSEEAISAASTAVLLADGASLTSSGTGFDALGDRTVRDAHGRGRELTLRRRRTEGEPDLTLTATLYDEQPHAALQSRLANDTGQPLHVREFHLLHGSLPSALALDSRVYRHGWQSWSPTLTLGSTEADIPPLPPVYDPGTQPQGEGLIASDLIAAVRGPESERGLLVGFISTADQLSQVWRGHDPLDLTAVSYADDITVASGTVLPSERAVVDITPNSLQALSRYGDTLAREMGALSWPHVPSGWCTWYHYFVAVSQEDVLHNLERLVEMGEHLPLEYVQIDDGYQAGIGDWLTLNERFPDGMAALADRIHERGFKTGLWLAPFLVGAGSRLFAAHPDWLVADDAGEPAVAIQNWGQLCYALDCTRPGVIDWLEHVFRTVTEGWGYDYVKIDFIYAAAIQGRRHDPNVTRAQAYRRGLEAIRRAVGDRFVLGCGAPIGPSVGLVNGMRVSPDVAPVWYPQMGRQRLSFPSAVNAIRGTINRFWTHNRLWLNDPDCLLARDSQTELTDDEVLTLATVIGMSGGMLLDSDDLSLVPAERREMIARLLPLRGEAALPLDLFDRDLPRVLWRPEAGLLALFNWSDEPADVAVELPVASARLMDYWTGQDYGVKQDLVAFRKLPAHACKLLRVQAAEG